MACQGLPIVPLVEALRQQQPENAASPAVCYVATGLSASQGLSVLRNDGTVHSIGSHLVMLDDGSAFVMSSQRFARDSGWTLVRCTQRVQRTGDATP